MCPTSCTPSRLHFYCPQYFIAQTEIVSGDILFAGTRYFWRLAVRSIAQADGRPHRKKFRQVILRSTEISLQAHTNVWIRPQRASVKIERNIYVIACLHVDPYDGVLLCASDDAL